MPTQYQKIGYARGERHHKAKFTDEEMEHIVEDIREGERLREQLSLYTDRAIAERYGTNSSNIWKIRNGIAWTHITEKAG